LLLHLQIGQKGSEQIEEAEGKWEPWEDHLLPLSELAARVNTVASLPVAARGGEKFLSHFTVIS
jgi:hypothetical protein